MATKKLQALLVGINSYLRPIIPDLQGTHKDIDNFLAHLNDNYKDDFEINAVVLKDEQATRGNIIKHFEQHLALAQENDVALFYFSGHGSWNPTNKAFHEFDPDGKEETLVCHDSRTKGKYDLSDKELAVLLNYVAKNNPEIVVFIDACHAGSMTRTAAGGRVRLLEGSSKARPLQHYLYDTTVDENKFYYYKQQLTKKAVTHIPASKHLLMTACSESELARETDDGGWFSQALVQTLKQSTTPLTYFQVYSNLYSAIAQQGSKQSPQLDAFHCFNANRIFLTGAESQNQQKRFAVRKQGDRIHYVIDFGAQMGFPLDLRKSLHFNLYPTKESTEQVGIGEVQSIGFNKSNIHLTLHHMDYEDIYWAELLDFAVAPMRVYFNGNDDDLELLNQALEAQNLAQIVFVPNAGVCPFKIVWEETFNAYRLYQRERSIFILEITKDDLNNPNALLTLINTLEHLSQWQTTGVDLAYAKSRIDTSDIGITFHALDDADLDNIYCEYREHQEDKVVPLEQGNQAPQNDYHKVILNYDGHKNFNYQVSLTNYSSLDTYYLAALLVTSDYGMIPLDSSIRLEPRQSLNKLIDSEFGSLLINRENDKDITHYLKLVISTSPIPTVQRLHLKELPLEKRLRKKSLPRAFVPRQTLYDWCTKTLAINLVRK